MSGHSNLKGYVDSLVNQSFLILDQIHESYFPLLEKSIYLSHSVDKSKISKTEFIIQQRIKYVETNCQQLHIILSKLPSDGSANPSKTDLSKRLQQLEFEQKRIWSAFKAIQFKRVEKERLEREQEEMLTRRFNNSVDDDNQSTNPTNNSSNATFSVDLDQEDPSSKISKPYPFGSSKNYQNSCNSSSSKLLRNQKPLVKRVRQRYLDFSTDFFGMTKFYLRNYCSSDFLLCILVLICLIFVMILVAIILKTSTHKQI